MYRFGQLFCGLDLWMEARASVKPDEIRRLSEIGARVIQFGVESLSTRVLKKMVKGTTTIQNLQAMKFCEQYGIQNTANIIIDYPGIAEEGIAETLDNIEFARAYRPLSVTEFSLVYQAPAYKEPERFDIQNIRNYHMYKLLMPPVLYERLFLTEKSFDSESVECVKPIWARVRAALSDWREHYRHMAPLVEGELLLSIQDGESFLKIRDFRWKDPRFYWMEGVERDLYLYCEAITPIQQVLRSFPQIEAATIDRLIAGWVERKLAFVEGQRVLSLAMSWGPISQQRSVAPVKVTAPGPRRLQVVGDPSAQSV